MARQGGESLLLSYLVTMTTKKITNYFIPIETSSEEAQDDDDTSSAQDDGSEEETSESNRPPLSWVKATAPSG